MHVNWHLSLTVMKRIGLLGCGAIGTTIAQAIDSAKIDAKLTHVYDESLDASKLLVSTLDLKPVIAQNAHMLSSYPIDIIVEAASQDAVRDCALSVIQNKCDLVVMSVGALLDESVFEVLYAACIEFGRTIHVPSGAIAGIDALRAVSDEIESVTLTTRKHPKSLCNVQGLVKMPQSGSCVVFDGNAHDAVAKFPKNINVAALLSLVTVGSENTRVCIIADNDVTTNSHTIEACGKFGTINVTVSNTPDPMNPKTSRLASLSVIELLRKLCSSSGAIRLGA